MKLIPTLLIVSGMLAPLFADAAVFSINTASAAGWTATAGGAVGATPFVVNGFGNANGQPVLSITSSGNSAGSFLPGGSLANFDGFWTAKINFTLPADAFNVQFSFINFFADDRAVLRLNGNIISSTGAVAPGGSLNGFMVFTDGGPAQPYTFVGPFGTVSGNVTSGFVPGLNTLDLILNNTGVGLGGGIVPGLAPNDGTGFGINGTLTYSVPEPSLAGLIFTGVLFTAGYRRQINRGHAVK